MAAENPRLSSRRRALGLAAGLLILVFLGIGVAAGWERVTRFDWQLEPAPLLGGFAAMVGMYVMGALGYVLILERLAERRLPRRRFVAGWGGPIPPPPAAGEVVL